MNNYFVMYDTKDTYNSFLVHDSDSASSAWDEAVAYIEKKLPDETCVITKFEKV